MKDSELKKQAEYYASLPYTVTIERRDDQGTYYVARFKELPHLLMTGATPEEALKELEEVKREWFEANLELGNKIPEPLKSRQYSGKVVLRMPLYVHESLARRAELEGVSLNQYMVAALAGSVGYPVKTAKRKARKTKTVKS